MVELDLSFNSLGDRGLYNLLHGLCETSTLRKLDLSHNEFTEECADTVEKIILGTKSLKELDLSWNFLNTGPGAVQNKRNFLVIFIEHFQPARKFLMLF